jgi:hypothetical protein
VVVVVVVVEAVVDAISASLRLDAREGDAECRRLESLALMREAMAGPMEDRGARALATHEIRTPTQRRLGYPLSLGGMLCTGNSVVVAVLGRRWINSRSVFVWLLLQWCFCH